MCFGKNNPQNMHSNDQINQYSKLTLKSFSPTTAFFVCLYCILFYYYFDKINELSAYHCYYYYYYYYFKKHNFDTWQSPYHVIFHFYFSPPIFFLLLFFKICVGKKGWMKLSKSIELSKFIHFSRILRVSRSQILFGFLNLSVFFPPRSL